MESKPNLINFIKAKTNEIKWKADFIGIDKDGNEIMVAHLFRQEDPKTKQDIIAEIKEYMNEYNYHTPSSVPKIFIKKYKFELIHGKLLK